MGFYRAAMRKCARASAREARSSFAMARSTRRSAPVARLRSLWYLCRAYPPKGVPMRRFAILVLATSLAAGAQSSDKKKAAAAQKPKPDPALVQAFGSSVGTWTCSGTTNMPKDMGGGQLKTKSKMTIRREAGGFAYSGDYTMAPNKAFPGMRGRMMWTYDPGAKKFYELAADTTGGAMRGESDGLKDGKMVWNEEGTMMGKSTKSTTTIVYKGKKALDIQFEMGDMNGADHCKKS